MGLKLGEDRWSRPVGIDAKTRSTHMQIVGSTGEGKSKLMELMIRQDIENRQGLCLIDPHGYLYKDLVRWCESQGLLDRQQKREILLFDPTDTGWAFGFNPLAVGTAELSFHVDKMVNATAQVWGGQNMDLMPTLKKCLRSVYHVLAEKRLTLIEAKHLINPEESAIKSYLTKQINDPTIQQMWQIFNQLKRHQFYEEFLSTTNRMMEFLTSPIIRNTIGQLEVTIDFRKIMDQGGILLVNLASADKLSDDNARLLGALIVNDLFQKAKGRPEGSRPFYLYIDECARYINDDIQRILDEGRKFGLHLILAHQHLSQLKAAGETVYHSVMTDAKTKIIFGGLSAEDARVLAEQTFLGELNLQERKEKLTRPMVVGYIKEWLESYSESTSTSSGRGKATASGSGTGAGAAEGEVMRVAEALIEDQLVSRTSTASSFDSTTQSETESSFESEAFAQAFGRHEAYVPVIEERSDSPYTLEEQIYRAMCRMVNQAPQHAIVKLPKKRTQFTRINYVNKPIVNDRRIDEFKGRCYEQINFILPRLEAERLIEKREEKLLIEAKEFESKQIAEPKNYRQTEGAPRRGRKPAAKKAAVKAPPQPAQAQAKPPSEPPTEPDNFRESG